MVCLLAAPWVQLSVSASNGWPHNALRHHWLVPITCHFRDCKALLVTSLTHVSGAIASVQTFTLNFYLLAGVRWQHRGGWGSGRKGVVRGGIWNAVSPNKNRGYGREFQLRLWLIDFTFVLYAGHVLERESDLWAAALHCSLRSGRWLACDNRW